MTTCALVALGLAGCAGGGGSQRAASHRKTPPLPPAPISAQTLTLSGRIVIVNGWQGTIAGQRLRVAAGRYAASGGGVALVSDSADLEREVRAPPGEGALRIVRREGRALVLRSRAGHRFTLDLRTLRLEHRASCPAGALRARLPRFALRDSRLGLLPLPKRGSDQLAILMAVLMSVRGHVERVDAAPAGQAPCGLTGRSLAVGVWTTTPPPVVGVIRLRVFVSRFARGWRAWRVQG